MLSWIVPALLGALTGDKGNYSAAMSASYALYVLERRLFGKWATLFWSIDRVLGDYPFRSIGLGLWTLFCDRYERDVYGWRRLWGWSIIWNFD